MEQSQSNYKILLIRLFTKHNKYLFDFTVNNPFEHLGLSYLSASLKKERHEVHILDEAYMDNIEIAIEHHILNSSLKLIGFTIDNYNFNRSMTLAQKIKNKNPVCHITVGGHMATNAANEILSDYQCIDSIICGFGEETIVKLAQHISEQTSYSELSGLVVRTSNSIVLNATEKFNINLDSIPFPDRSLFNHNSLNTARIITSRGCFYSCNYCTTPSFIAHYHRKKWFQRTSENIVEEVKELVSNFKIRQILFSDDNFIGNKKNGRNRALEITKSIERNNWNFKFWIMARVDCFFINDDIFIKQLKKAGLWGIFLGIESGSDHELTKLNKKTNRDTNLKIVRLFQRNNIMVELGFINFYPFSTISELISNLDFLYELGEANYFSYFTSKLKLYPGIGILDELKKEQLLGADYDYTKIDGYKFQHPDIELIYNSINEVSAKTEVQISIIWNLKRLNQIIGDTCSLCFRDKNIEPNRKLEKVKKGIDTILKEINQLNFEHLSMLYKSYKNQHTAASSFDESYYENLGKNLKQANKYLHILQSTLKDIDDYPEKDFIQDFLYSEIYKDIKYLSNTPKNNSVIVEPSKEFIYQ